MAELTKQALIVENNTNFPNNNTGFITPALLREFNTDMIDSTVNQTRYNADSASWNAEINALDPSGSAASIVALNNFTASIQGTNAFTASATISINALNAFTSSVTPTATGSLLTTASFSGNTMTFTKGDGSTFGVVIPDVSGSTTTALNQATASLQAFTASVAGTNAFTQSAQLEINSLEAFTASVAGTNTFTASLAGTNTFTQSAQLEINALEAFTASIYNTNPWTASINTFTASTNARLNSIEATTASLQSQINLISGSGTVIAVDALNQFTASIQQTNAFTASAKLEFAALEAFTASVAGTNAFTQSAQNSLNSLNAATSSYITSAMTASMSVASASVAATASLARNVVISAINNNQSTLPAGTVIRITGATGDNPRFNSASWDNDTTSANTLGILANSTANGAYGEVVTLGTVLGVNTDPALGFSAGDVLYLSSSGQFTNVQPQAPLHIVTLGEVLRVQQNNGSIFVNISNGWELNELHNVRIVNPLQGDIIVYEASSSLWKNVPSSSVTPTDISALNAFTASVAGTNAFTASIAGTNAFTASALTTASVNLNTITFTKGDASTFNITVNTGSGGPSTDITALNAFTASIAGTNTFTQSAQLEINALEAFTASIAGTNAFTASALTTASFSGNTLTFTKGDNSTFGVVIPDVSGSGAAFPFTGSAGITGSLSVVGPISSQALTATTSNAVVINGDSATGIKISDRNSFTTGIWISGSQIASGQDQIRINNENRGRIVMGSALGAGTDRTTFALSNQGTNRAAINGYIGATVGFNYNTSDDWAANAIYISASNNTVGVRNFMGFNARPNEYAGTIWNYVFAPLPFEQNSLGGMRMAAFGHMYVSQSFTASIQSGYAWVGGPNNTTIAVATSSFAGTAVDISALNAFTASVAGTNTFTQSAQLEINALEAFTASIAGTNAFTQSVNSSISALNTFTASVTESVITSVVTNNGASYYIIDGVDKPKLSFAPGLTYRFDLSGIAGSHPFKFSTSPNGPTEYTTGVTSGSGFIQIETGYNTASPLYYYCTIHSGMGNEINVLAIEDLVTTASFNDYTSSLAGTNAFTASIAGTNLFTQSAQLEINSLEAFTASIAGTNAFTASALTTASFSGNTLTFTKGNGTTFGVTIPDVSGSTINTGSFATTGSNAFFGNQTISGSLGISGSAITFVSGTLSGSVVTNIGDTFTDVAPVNRIITLTSASYAALASGSTTDPNTLYIVSGSTSGSIAGAALIGNNTFSGSNVYTGSVQGNVVAMSISSNTASMDFNAGNFFTLTLVSGSIPTFINPTNIKAGQTVSLVVTQASVLSGSLAFPTTFKFPYGSAYTASVTASAVDVITFMTVNTSTIYASSVKNLV